MKFSVLMSVYFKESADNLYDALRSLVNQSVIPSEIVLVKDGPLPVRLEEIIDNFKQENPDLVKELSIPENRGLGNALAVGLDACSFDLVARMDSDDISDYSRFKKQLLFLEQHPDIDVVGSTLKEFTETVGDSNVIKRCPSLHADIIKVIKFRNPINHATIMFRRSRVLDAGGYNGNTLMFEDWALFFRLWKAGLHFHNLTETLYYMRIDANLNSIIRRRGMSYVRHEINFLMHVRKIGGFSTLDMCKYAVLRLPIRLMPTRVVFWVYKYFLRRRE